MEILESVRSAMESRMVDTVEIRRPDPGPGTLNPSTFAVTATDTLIYSGAAMYGDRLSGHERQEGFADKHEHRGMLRIPADEDDVRVGDLVTFTAGPMASDDVWLIEANLKQSAQVTQRFRITRKAVEVHRA